MRSRPRTVPRAVTGLLAVAVAVAAAGCEKKSTLVVPDGAGPDGSTPAPTADEVVLRYAATTTRLRQKASFETTTTGGGQFVEAKVAFDASLVVAPQAGKLKVVWDLEGVDAVKVSGALQGKGAGDPKAFLLEVGRGAYLTDLRGDSDAAVSDALPENKAMQDRLAAVQAEIKAKTASGQTPDYPAGAEVLPYLQPVVRLPALPEPGLVVGKETKVERDEERELASVGVVLPLHIHTTYTLVRIDTSGSMRVAEVQFEGGASGEAQGQGDVGTVSIASQYEGMLLFNLDRGVPMSYDVTRTETWNLGQITGETTTLIKATWDAGEAVLHSRQANSSSITPTTSPRS
jgi:hypothetical protein